jgi:twitching motility protein PilT
VQPRLRARLADALQYVVGQWLVPRTDAGRIAVLEILASTQRTRELIRDGESEHKTFYKVLSEGTQQGMQTFDQHLIKLFEDGFVAEETVRHYCTDRIWVGRQIDRIRHLRRQAGDATAVEALDDELANLQMDYTHGRSKEDRDE